MGVGFIAWAWKAETLHGKSFRIKEYTGMGLCRQYHALICPLRRQSHKILTVVNIVICKYAYFSNFRHFTVQTCRTVKSSGDLRKKERNLFLIILPFQIYILSSLLLFM